MIPLNILLSIPRKQNLYVFLERLGITEEVAGLSAFLTSDDANILHDNAL
ncbi:MAG: hypothetical protein ACXAEU_17785 [Candidatus Hodarchaeales archaeon]